MNNEFHRIWKETVVALSRHLIPGSEENYENPQSG
jgi:hypothetical protein